MSQASTPLSDLEAEPPFAAASPGRSQYALYALTVLVSAFLLFQIEPTIAKMILPWFGGSANVWTTCLLFFQIMLLLGHKFHDLGRRVGADPERLDHGRGDVGSQAGHDPLVLADLDLEPLPTAGELAQGVLGGGQWARHRPGAESDRAR